MPSKQQPLLSSAALEGAEEGVWSFSATFGDHLGTLRIESDGTCNLNVEEEPTSSLSSCLSSCRAPRYPAQISGGDIVGASLDGADQLCIWHMPLSARDRNSKPQRELRCTAPLRLSTPAEAQSTVTLLRRLCCWWGLEDPPRVQVIINPASGPGRGQWLFDHKMRPVLEAAGLKVSSHVTQARAHATEIVQQLVPGSVDAIAAIGGDGTTHEVLQGLLQRPDWDVMRRTPFVQLPCGSGNALAACTGLWTLHTALHALVKGHRQALDVMSYVQAPARRAFAFLSITFGLITNIDIGTEHLRWMGGTRFTVGALYQILLSKTHHCRVALVEAERDASVAGASAATTHGSRPSTSAGTGSSEAGDGAKLEGRQQDGNGQQQQKRQQQSAVADGPTAAVGTGAGATGDASAQGPPLQHIGRYLQREEHAPLGEAQLAPGWRLLGDCEVQLFSVCNLPRLDMQFHFAPDASMSSGHANLIYSRRLSRAKGLELLLAAENAEHMHLVEQQRVLALAIEPLGTGTWLVVDGEVVPFKTLFCEVHPALCSVIVAPPADQG